MKENPEMRRGQRAVRKTPPSADPRSARQRMNQGEAFGTTPQNRSLRSNEKAAQGKRTPRRDGNEFSEFLRDLLNPENLKYRRDLLLARLRLLLSNFTTNIFQSKERIICGVVTFGILLFMALLQTTLFSTIKPFGNVPDLMLSFTLALSVTEGRRWGAVWGIVAAVFIESLNVSNIYLLPLLYMLTGYFGGIICRHILTESFAVRAVLAVAVMPFKGAFTAIYAVLSPLPATAGEIFFEIVLPEAASTLLLAVPVHILVYFCMKPFHHTRAEMVSER